jgi:hypothetical protein
VWIRNLGGDGDWEGEMITLCEDELQGLRVDTAFPECEFFSTKEILARGCQGFGHYLCLQECKSYTPPPEDTLDED